MRKNPNTRALGPYPERGGKRWRVVVVDASGARVSQYFESEGEAKSFIGSFRVAAAEAESLTVEDALKLYRESRIARGLSEFTTKYEFFRLRGFLPIGVALPNFTPTLAQKTYDTYTQCHAVDTHRQALSDAKQFFAYAVKQKLTTSNPFAGVEGVGTRNRGKTQLRIDEARRWTEEALRRAGLGEPGAIAALCALWLGMRRTEIQRITARDVDDGGRVLWVEGTKTRAARRRVRVPARLAEPLAKLAGTHEPTSRIFPGSEKWVIRWVRKICVSANVPIITTHSLRGLHASLAEDAGVSAEAVAKALGHTSPSMTHAHYTQPEVVSAARQERVLDALEPAPPEPP
jgi:integrase